MKTFETSYGLTISYQSFSKISILPELKKPELHTETTPVLPSGIELSAAEPVIENEVEINIE